MRIRHIGAFAPRLAVLALAVLAGTSGLAMAQTPALTLNQVLEAARNNWDVSQLRHAASAARADVASADHVPFPTLSVKLSSIDLQNGVGEGDWLRERRVDKGVGLDWTWERGNKRALRTQAAQLTANAVQADAQDGELQQLLAASGAFFDLSAAQEREQLVQAMADGTLQIATVAARRVGAGDLARQDALRLEIESERAKGDVAVARLDRERAAQALNLLLGSAAASVTVRAESQWPVATEAQGDTEWTETAIHDLVSARPDVRAATERVSAAQAALDVASAQKKADVTWGVSLDHFPGTSTSLLELRMQMPLQYGYEFQGETGRARAQLAAAEAALDKVRRAAELDVRALLAQLRGAAMRSLSYERDILPRAREVAKQAEFAYEKGALALSDLLDARRTLRAVDLDALGARADHAKAVTAWRLRTQGTALAPKD